MSLLDAKPVDEQKEKLKKYLAIGLIVVVVAGVASLFLFKNFSEKRTVDHFFTALQQKRFEDAYGIWVADKNWKQSGSKYDNYSYGQFYNDWGPGGQYGPIKSYEIEAALANEAGNGVIVGIRVNDRAERAFLYVNKKDQSISFSPVRLSY